MSDLWDDENEGQDAATVEEQELLGDDDPDVIDDDTAIPRPIDHCKIHARRRGNAQMTVRTVAAAVAPLQSSSLAPPGRRCRQTRNGAGTGHRLGAARVASDDFHGNLAVAS